jgi:LEA14-like dessication related protein
MSTRIEDPELRTLLAAIQLEGVVKLLDANITQSICVDSHGNETEKITIEYPKTTE